MLRVIEYNFYLFFFLNAKNKNFRVAGKNRVGRETGNTNEPQHEKTNNVDSDRFDTNQAVQILEMARSLKF